MKTRKSSFLVAIGILIPATLSVFASQARAAAHSPSIDLASHAAARANAISAVILASPAARDFGVVNVGDSPTVTFSITNDGGSGADVLTLAPAVGNPLVPIEIVSLSLSSLRPVADFPGDVAILTVKFTPTGTGFVSQDIFMNSNAPNDGGAYSVQAVGMGNEAPSFTTCPGPAGFPAFINTCANATATDPEDNVISYSISSTPALPPGATFDTVSGQLCWTPGLLDVGTYTVTICAADAHGAASDPCCTFNVVVSATNQPPVANPGGPYAGTIGAPIFFDGSDSFDPDTGQLLTYAWSFGDGQSSAESTPSHIYDFAGTYIVTLTVTDDGNPQFSNTAGTAAVIAGAQSGQVVMKLTGGGLKLFGGSLQEIGLEPNTVPATAIDPASMRLSTDTPNAGSVTEIAPSDKLAHVGDLDNDGLGELDVFFTRASLNSLLGNLANNTVVNLFLRATTFEGTPIVGEISGIKVKTGGGAHAISSLAAPNPFNPETAILYTLKDGGKVTVRIFGQNGQLVRALKEGFATAGTHEVRWDGRDYSGKSVGSGLYFVKVQQGSEYSINKLSLLK